MKIRTQFIINLIVLGSILLLIFAAVMITNQWVESTHQQEALATLIERQAYELGYLANQYLLYRESQQAERWESKFASFSSDLSKVNADTPEQQALLASIQTNQQRLEAIFVEVRASIENASQTQQAGFDEKFMQVSWSRLEVQNQEMIFNASRLERMLNEQEHRLERLARLLTFVLIGVLGAFLLLTYRLTFRRILQAIAMLQDGTRIIGSGDLDFAIAVKNEDEIGELSHTFNQMTASLKQVTASKADLEKEITERKRAEEQLRYQAHILANIHDAVVATDLGRRITSWNLAAERMFGWTQEQVLGKPADEVVRSEITDEQRAEALKAMQQGTAYALQLLRYHKDGHPVWVESTNVAIRDSSGNVTGYVSVGRDITERKRAELKLQESEARYRSLFENMLSGYAHCQMLFDQNNKPVDFTYINVNAAFETLTGLKSVEGKNVSEVIPGIRESNPELIQTYGRVSQTGKPERFETHIPALGIWFSVAVYSPKQDYFVAVFDNITERKQAEAEISNLARFPTENPNPILRVQTDGRLTYANASSQELLAMWGCGVEDYLPEALRELTAAAVDNHVNKMVDVPCNDKVYSIMLVPIMDGGYVNIYGRDVTERKQAEEALHRLTEDLRRSNAELEQFAYVASHDLQEPLRMISSYVQLLARRYQGKLDSDADQFIAYAVDGATRMQHLINDLLAFSRVGTRGGLMGLSSCEKILAESLINLQIAMEESNAIVTHDPLPTIFCDPPQLGQVFQNLLGNSIKFRGQQALHIHISAKCEESEWLFSVCDNGIGLDPKFGERIFDIFQRLHSRTAYPGTGIGLAICKRIIQRHGGRIWVESQPGEGATFYFTLPIKETS